MSLWGHKGIWEMTVFDGGTSDKLSEGQEGSIPSMLPDTLQKYVSENITFEAYRNDRDIVVIGKTIVNGIEYSASFKTNKVNPEWIVAFIVRDIVKQAFGFNLI